MKKCEIILANKVTEVPFCKLGPFARFIGVYLCGSQEQFSIGSRHCEGCKKDKQVAEEISKSPWKRLDTLQSVLSGTRAGR